MLWRGYLLCRLPCNCWGYLSFPFKTMRTWWCWESLLGPILSARARKRGGANPYLEYWKIPLFWRSCSKLTVCWNIQRTSLSKWIRFIYLFFTYFSLNFIKCLFVGLAYLKHITKLLQTGYLWKRNYKWE